MTKFILSPVGTSLLNNIAGENRWQLNKHANDSENEIPVSVRELVEQIMEEAQGRLREVRTTGLKTLSAELNSLLSIYSDTFEGQKRDIHFLIATDTFQSRITSHVLRDYLTTYFNVVEVFTPGKMSTKNKDSFHHGIRELLRWCDETLNDYKKAGYEIVFNLTGGFKSLQGYLNTIGMFYADKIVYIFEGSDELITIPRLPIEINGKLFKEKASTFLRLSQSNEGIDKRLLKDIPEIMLEEYQNGKCVLSDWGDLSWNKAKEVILPDELIPLPLIFYTTSFKEDFKNTDRTSDKIRLQQKIAKISCILQEHHGDISVLKAGRSGGILYDNYSGKNDHLGHFRINQELRVSCEYQNNILELRHYGQHDYVNDNP